jgi:hypothetical protein
MSACVTGKAPGAAGRPRGGLEEHRRRVARHADQPLQRARGRHGTGRRAHGHLCIERRLLEAAHAPARVDRVADVGFGAVQPLASRRTHQGVVVQRGHHRNVSPPRFRGQVERQVQEALCVHDVGLHRVQYLSDAGGEFG